MEEDIERNKPLFERFNTSSVTSIVRFFSAEMELSIIMILAILALVLYRTIFN